MQLEHEAGRNSFPPLVRDPRAPSPAVVEMVLIMCLAQPYAATGVAGVLPLLALALTLIKRRACVATIAETCCTAPGESKCSSIWWGTAVSRLALAESMMIKVCRGVDPRTV